MKRLLWPLLDTFSKIEDLASTSQGGWVKKSKKKIFRGKPPVMSGEVYRCPTDSPELFGRVEKKSTKNRNCRKGPGRPGGGRGDIGGTLAPHTDASSPQKINFFTTQILTNFDLPGRVCATKPPGASAGIAKRNQFFLTGNPCGAPCRISRCPWGHFAQKCLP